MKALHTALIAAAVISARPAFAQGTSGMDHSPHAAKTGHGVGVLTAIDPRAAAITIKHGPIPALGWPGMTMTFKARPPAFLHGLRVGQRVEFDVAAQGMAAEVTAIRPVK